MQEKNYMEKAALIETLMNNYNPNMSFNDLLLIINNIPTIKLNTKEIGEIDESN